jgi:quercetin dioxygenase-like cupin family protein
MRSIETIDSQPVASAWSEAQLVDLTIQLASRVAQRGEKAVALSTAPPDRPWSVPLLITPGAEVWLLGWPAGLTTAPHTHGGTGAALTVVEGSLSEECLDPTIWTTGRRTTWKAGASTLFPAGHVHLLGAAGDRPAVAVHAWSNPARSASGAAGRAAPVGGGRAAGGRRLGGGRGPADPVGAERGGGRRGCWARQAAHGAPDLLHVGDRVTG